MSTAPIMPTPAPEQTPTPAPVDGKAAGPATPPTPADAGKERDSFAEKLDLLARRDRALYHKQQQIKQKEQELAAREAQWKEWQDLKGSAKKNPIKAIENLGLSYDDITRFIVEGGKPSPQDEVQDVRSELQKLRDELAERDKQAQETARQQQERLAAQAIEDFKTEITSFIDTNAGTYELLALRGTASEDVFNAINDAFAVSYQEWQRNGSEGPMPKPMSIDEAAKVVETYYEKEIERLAQAKKLAGKFGAPNPTPTPADGKGNPAPKTPAPTLTNQMSGSAAPSMLPAKTEQDRIARALAKLNGE